MTKAIKLSIALTLLLFGTSVFSQSASSADALVDYILRLGNLPSMLRNKVDSNPAFSAEEKQYLKSVVSKVDTKELVTMFSSDVSNAFTSQELENCTKMVSTPALVKSLNIVNDVPDTENSVDALMANLNKAEQDEVVAYFDTDCFLRTASILGTPENQEKIKTFGYNLICSVQTKEGAAILASNAFLQERCSTIGP
jgi:hypothetical protein